MAVTNHDRVDLALKALHRGLLPFVAREYINHHRSRTPLMLEQALNRRITDPKRPLDDVDIASLLRIMWDSWHDIFRKTLGQSERTLVSELRDVRNRWAHETKQNRFSGDDTYRALDSAQRLLTAVGSADEAEALEKLKNDLLRLRFDEQRRSSQRRAAASIVFSVAAEAIRPWREVVTPHPDVSTGRFQQAEFAATCGRCTKAKAATSTAIRWSSSGVLT
ncbi:Swt1 family HEPN domain-containing protein [Candidatus Poriferisodalis sp.]|uniref:Swt1 family HEPN domain-containing protein n=1 Tax=Candidatus Poriferisodalis sp. TaxID=3101277 RepID=UPI003B01EA66